MFRVEWANQQTIPFRFDELLGKGKFGEVYAGVNRQTGEKRALKVLKKCSRITTVERSIMGHLPEHPNVVQMESSFELGEDLCVFVLELCDTDLRSYLDKKPGGKLDAHEAKMVMRGMALGLQALGRSNIFHRDLKSENVFLKIQENGELVAKLGDFGLAKQLTRADETFYSCTGSPLYVAPEIWSQAGYTTKSDLYSCGVVFYEMMTGNPPFHYSRNKLQLRRLALYSGVSEKDVEGLALESEGKALMRGLLQKAPKNRLGWEGFFDHAWFSEGLGCGSSSSCGAQVRQVEGFSLGMECKKQATPEVVF